MCRVLNKHHAGVLAGAVYVGRGSKWGNPFRIGPDGDRVVVIAKHARWLTDQHHLLRALDDCAARIWCASARRFRVTVTCCCGPPMRAARTALPGGAPSRPRREARERASGTGLSRRGPERAPPGSTLFPLS